MVTLTSELLRVAEVCLKLHSTGEVQFAGLQLYLRLIGQEGDVDLCQGLNGFGSPTLHHFIEQRVGAGCKQRNNCFILTSNILLPVGEKH